MEVRAIVTEHSQHFFDKSTVPCNVYTDDDEWKVKDKQTIQLILIFLTEPALWTMSEVYIAGNKKSNRRGKIIFYNI